MTGVNLKYRFSIINLLMPRNMEISKFIFKRKGFFFHHSFNNMAFLMFFSVSTGIFYHKYGPPIEIRYLDLIDIKIGIL